MGADLCPWRGGGRVEAPLLLQLPLTHLPCLSFPCKGARNVPVCIRAGCGAEDTEAQGSRERGRPERRSSHFHLSSTRTALETSFPFQAAVFLGPVSSQGCPEPQPWPPAPLHGGSTWPTPLCLAILTPLFSTHPVLRSPALELRGEEAIGLCPL